MSTVPLPSEHEMREELHRAVLADLLGPAGGEFEEIKGPAVHDRYLIGKLAPREVSPDAAQLDDVGKAESTRGEEATTEGFESLHRSLMPSSFGLTFSIDAEVASVQVEARWGAYERVKGEAPEVAGGDDEEKESTVWKRHPAGGIVNLSLSPGEPEPLSPDPEISDVMIKAIVREADVSGTRSVSVFLVNDQHPKARSRDSAWVFQPEVTIRARDGSAVFRKRQSRQGLLDDSEHQILSMLYRSEVEFAVGHGVGVHAEVSPGDPTRAVSISTRVSPMYDLPRTEVPTASDFPALSGLVLDMKALCEMGREELVDDLEILASAYAEWISGLDARVRSGDFAEFGRAPGQVVADCTSILERLRTGIETLRTSDDALRAFGFANRAMWLQRVRSKYSQVIRRGNRIELADVDIPENRTWYPFQLAFILLGIPALADPTHRQRTDPGAAIADLLWFPTGGGKTEAYLGLAAFAMAIRRLQGEMGDLDGSRGVTVIMRYTLRLLTIQQFQRASALICAMEVIRREKPGLWGDTPFRLGLWVGQHATPNRTEDARQAIENAKGNSWKSTGTGTPHQLRNCPWCGAPIDIKAGDLECREAPSDVGRTFTFCSDKLGQCEFTRAKAPGEGIPVVVVDEEIYKLLPAMIIGTVDKFAQMPWKGEVQTLFGKVAGECPRHGFISPESSTSCSGEHRKSKTQPAATRIACKQLRPPDLIIQDEFHLISGPLGTIVGLYETAVDELCSWQVGERVVRPLVVASTATVRKAAEQMHGVFLRRVAVFPPPGLDHSDNFFSVQRPVTAEKPGRRYMGICAPGHARPAVLIRVYTAFLTAAEGLRQKYGAAADPWLTCVGYFNALRELGGMLRLVQDDVRTRCYRILKGDLDRPGLAQRDIRVIEELTSRKSSTDIPAILDRLEHRFRGPEEAPTKPAIDVVLCTNMISVGVDVPRLSLMVVNGQPKTTAEYIQATSRVGRFHPGLVCSVLNWARPRDLSHYETFEHYHATFYSHVEAQSVTPFSPRAIDRGLTGVMVSLMRLSDMELNPNEGASKLDKPDRASADAAKSAIARRASSCTEDTAAGKSVERAISQRLDEWVNETEQRNRVLGYRRKKDDRTVNLLHAPGIDVWNRFTVPTSMREVEPTTWILLERNVRDDDPAWVPPKTGSDRGGGN